MQSQLTIRLPEELEREDADAARRLRLKRSDIVRLALERFLSEPQVREEQSPYAKVKNLLGSVKSGVSDLGSAHREHLVKRIRRHE
jgi:metal-responsive CopG/Arc/MetJ family transcriptional regulator